MFNLKGGDVMKKDSLVELVVLLFWAIGTITGLGNQKPDQVKLLNVSYDPTRELYTQFNNEFAKYWYEKTGDEVVLYQSHGGSGKQARSVIEGLGADIVTLGLAYDIDAIGENGLIKSNWQEAFKDNSSPYTSTIVFLVRKGNPKNIKDWDDLAREDISVITPNPKSSGGARWNYLAAWGYSMEKNKGDESRAKEFIKKVYENVEVLDSAARGSIATFTQRGIGDVLIAWENEALLSLEKLGKDEFSIVVPSISILAEPPIAIVDQVVDKKGTRELAQGYLDYLYTRQGQEIAAQNYYRPRNQELANAYEDIFPKLKLLTIDQSFGGWQQAHKKHFRDGGIFDEIYGRD